jgi:S-adenosylmethionine-diacylglycerol 3-amino-3-carboxypropyl transferase
LDNPRQVISIDLNPIQNYLLELKLACFRALSYPDMLTFLGVRPHAHRLHLYENIKPYLSREARIYWSGHAGALDAGVLRQGKQDRYFFQFGSLLRILLGNSKIDRLLGLHDLAAQQRFFDREWNGFRWRLLFDFFFSRRVMSFHMDPAHFRLIKNLRFGPVIRKQVDYIMKYSPMWENYFVYWVFTRSYPGGECLPPYLQESNFDAIRSRLDRVTIVTSELETFLTGQQSESISKFNLSNVFDWVDNDVFGALIEEISKVAQPDSRLCYYNLLNRRRVSLSQKSFRRQPEAAASLMRRNRAV